MSYQQTSKHCRYCKKQVLVNRQGTNHLLHLFLTLFTGGLWLIIWILCSIKIGGWRCSICGSVI